MQAHGEAAACAEIDEMLGEQVFEVAYVVRLMHVWPLAACGMHCECERLRSCVFAAQSMQCVFQASCEASCDGPYSSYCAALRAA